MQILNYVELAEVLGSPLPAGGPIRGGALLLAVQGPGFPALQYGEPYSGWPSDAVVGWAGITVPTVSAVVPASAALGSASFTLHVQGAGFLRGAVILWNGSPEPTTWVSPSELTTLVDMSTAQVAIPIPVAVQVAGLVTNSVTFTLLPAGTVQAAAAPWERSPDTPPARILAP